MAKPSGWKGHHVSRLVWKQIHNAKVSLQAAQDDSDHGSSSQQPSGCVARDEPIDLTESNDTQREPSPSHPSSTDAITSHASRKRKTDDEGPRSVELHPGCSRKDLVEGSITPSDAVSVQNSKSHTGLPWPRYSDGMVNKVRTLSIFGGIANDLSSLMAGPIGLKIL